MALRTRAAWSTLRSEIRSILLETTGASSFWTDALLLNLANHALEQRMLEMSDTHEGWVRQAYLADTVAGQREYSLPEGIERVRSVHLRYEVGGQVEEVQLNRNDRIGQDYFQPASGDSFRQSGFRPQYRLLDNLIIIEPPDPETRTNGLRLEVDALAPALTGDSDTLALMFPISTETLLVYDVVLLALGVEGIQGNEESEGYVRLVRFHRLLESSWRSMIQVRNQSRVFGQPFNLGD